MPKNKGAPQAVLLCSCWLALWLRSGWLTGVCLSLQAREARTGDEVGSLPAAGLSWMVCTGGGLTLQHACREE